MFKTPTLLVTPLANLGLKIMLTLGEILSDMVSHYHVEKECSCHFFFIPEKAQATTNNWSRPSVPSR
jgi:hypothetical protein